MKENIDIYEFYLERDRGDSREIPSANISYQSEMLALIFGADNTPK